MKTSWPWSLCLVVALNAGIWLFNVGDGLSPWRPTSAELFAWGANSASAVVQYHEYWRLLSAPVLHAGVVHLLINMTALWVVGRQVCPWLGNGAVLLICGGSALVGSAASLHAASRYAVSVGASGAVFGLVGALLVGLVARPGLRRVPLLAGLAGMLVLVAALALTGRGGDHAAHAGGLVGGAAMAWLLSGRTRMRSLSALGLLALMVGGLVAGASPGVDHHRTLDAQLALDALQPRREQAERALRADVEAARLGQLSDAELAQAMAQRHIPAFQALVEGLFQVRLRGSLPGVSDLQEHYAIREEMMVMEVGQVRGTLDPGYARQRMAELRQRLQTVRARLDQATAESTPSR